MHFSFVGPSLNMKKIVQINMAILQWCDAFG